MQITGKKALIALGVIVLISCGFVVGNIYADMPHSKAMASQNDTGTITVTPSMYKTWNVTPGSALSYDVRLSNNSSDSLKIRMDISNNQNANVRVKEILSGETLDTPFNVNVEAWGAVTYTISIKPYRNTELRIWAGTLEGTEYQMENAARWNIEVKERK